MRDWDWMPLFLFLMLTQVGWSAGATLERGLGPEPSTHYPRRKLERWGLHSSMGPRFLNFGFSSSF